MEFIEKKPEVDLAALNEYFSFQNVLSQRTLFKDIKILSPGTIQEWDIASGVMVEEQYWDFRFIDNEGLTIQDAEDKIYSLLQDAVREQTVSDVPISSYLSGGMDSGTIADFVGKTVWKDKNIYFRI